ncbi:MAG TPA: pilus assembly protein TadG-related protein [Bryobacteraceae bacterium]|nr:pilus assembly protein TadG-related protein [Bryobacteraceae bacterium]
MRKGFVLSTSALCMAGLLALIGLATDVVRLYVSRDELRVFLDRAAGAASFELDGTRQGIARAQTVALSGPGAKPDGTYSDSQAVNGVSVQFASVPAGPFNAAPPSPAGQRFVKVQAAAVVNLYFLPLFPGVPAVETLTAFAVAGQCQSSGLDDGLAPYSPDALDAGVANFGFVAGPGLMQTWLQSPPRSTLRTPQTSD